jgi:ribosomal protein S4E
MTTLDSAKKLRDAARCQVVAGTHMGKSGIVKDINTSKTGHVAITVLQANGERFKTLAKNVVVNTIPKCVVFCASNRSASHLTWLNVMAKHWIGGAVEAG